MSLRDMDSTTIKTPTPVSKAKTPSKPAAAPEHAPLGQPSGVQPTPKRVGAQQRTRRKLIASFVLIFVLPSLIGIIYYACMASDRYASSASFVVRQTAGTAPGGSDLISSFTGITASGSTASDSYIIRRYLEGPDLLRKLDSALGLRSHYSAPEIDYVSRFDSSLPFEDFVTYWQRRITTAYDNTTGILSFEVQAFDDDLAMRMGQAVLEAADALVNDLSVAAREDSVFFARQEVSRAEERLRRAQVALRDFRTARGAVDPTLNVQLDAQLIGNLEAQRAELQTRIRAMEGQIDEDGPVVRQMRREADALDAQIETRRALVGQPGDRGNGGTDAGALGEFESLTIEQTFAQQLYASALTSLESARMEADRQQRYLAIFERPYFPEDAIYPLRLRNALLLAGATLLIWMIGSLVTYAVRDHLR
ncbi:hypothetical protein [Salipiger mangrovisoli]|uniref:Capsular polysaccharide transport system permease protein n=1 Tax=Salipiger mangrovisoli TaxID=2865933 RepID=A0ABR9XAQ7_9RHOB|nr:hypothetical protein [Salipiger mangrovisoli]MBE9640517.1 hypothetical protein [Salipiger mangrovisoli]